MAFLLSVHHQDDGFTRIIIDNGPTSRVQLLSPPGASGEIVGRPIDDVLRDTFTEVRPPAVSRRRVR